MIGVFNDSIDYFTAQVKGAFVAWPCHKLKLVEELKATHQEANRAVAPTGGQVTTQHREVNRRSTLLTKFNNIKAQVERDDEALAQMSEEDMRRSFKTFRLFFSRKKRERRVSHQASGADNRRAYKARLSTCGNHKVSIVGRCLGASSRESTLVRL